MNKLIKGNLVMKNVADKDVNMYVKAGWKLEVKPKKKTKKEIELIENAENNNSIVVKE